MLSASPAELAATTHSQWELAMASGASAADEVPAERDLLIDALHGYSLSGPPRAETAALLETLEGATVVSVDVASGLEVASGELLSAHASAAATVALAAPKRGTLEQEHRDASATSTSPTYRCRRSSSSSSQRRSRATRSVREASFASSSTSARRREPGVNQAGSGAEPGPIANRMSAPPPLAFSALTQPSWSSATLRTMASPSPEPGCLRAFFER